MMRCSLYLILLCGFTTLAQDTIVAQKVDITKSIFKDVAVHNNFIYAITEGDSLYEINTENNNYQLIYKGLHSIEVDHDGNFYGLDRNALWTSRNARYWSRDYLFNNFDSQYAGNLLLDKNELPVVITNYSVYSDHVETVAKKKYEGVFIKLNKGRVITPSKAFIINRYLYMDTDLGEWGSYSFYFDLRNKTFARSDQAPFDRDLFLDENTKEKDYPILFPDYYGQINDRVLPRFPTKFYVSNIKGMAENNDGEVIVSHSLQHFDISGGLDLLTFFEDNLYSPTSLEYMVHRKYPEHIEPTPENRIFAATEYLGPIVYNPYSDSFILYSNLGFFKIYKSGDDYKRELMFIPKIQWKFGQGMALGYHMAMQQIIPLNAKAFVFRTISNGIGYYDGKNLTFFR